ATGKYKAKPLAIIAPVYACERTRLSSTVNANNQLYNRLVSLPISLCSTDTWSVQRGAQFTILVATFYCHSRHFPIDWSASQPSIQTRAVRPVGAPESTA